MPSFTSKLYIFVAALTLLLANLSPVSAHSPLILDPFKHLDQNQQCSNVPRVYSRRRGACKANYFGDEESTLFAGLTAKKSAEKPAKIISLTKDMQLNESAYERIQEVTIPINAAFFTESV